MKLGHRRILRATLFRTSFALDTKSIDEIPFGLPTRSRQEFRFDIHSRPRPNHDHKFYEPIVYPRNCTLLLFLSMICRPEIHCLFFHRRTSSVQSLLRLFNRFETRAHLTYDFEGGEDVFFISRERKKERERTKNRHILICHCVKRDLPKISTKFIASQTARNGSNTISFCISVPNSLLNWWFFGAGTMTRVWRFDLNHESFSILNRKASRLWLLLVFPLFKAPTSFARELISAVRTSIFEKNFVILLNKCKYLWLPC